jgi:hypothetical protein
MLDAGLGREVEREVEEEMDHGVDLEVGAEVQEDQGKEETMVEVAEGGRTSTLLPKQHSVLGLSIVSR